MSFFAWFDLAHSFREDIVMPEEDYNTLRTLLEQRKGITEGGNVSGKDLCDFALRFNSFIRYLYESLATWSNEPPVPGVLVTVQESEYIVKQLSMMYVSPENWTDGYYEVMMREVFDLMTTGTNRNKDLFHAELLTPKQAAEVIGVFSEWLGTKGVELVIPYGGHELLNAKDCCHWCERCEQYIHDTDIKVVSKLDVCEGSCPEGCAEPYQCESCDYCAVPEEQYFCPSCDNEIDL